MAVKVIDDPPVRVQIVRKTRKDKGKKKKPKKPKAPIPVRIVPPPPPPPPSPEEIKAQEKADFEVKLAADREARRKRNVDLNAKDSQQGPSPTFGVDNCPPVYKDGLKTQYTNFDLKDLPKEQRGKFLGKTITTCRQKEIQKLKKENKEEKGKKPQVDDPDDPLSLPNVMKDLPDFLKGAIQTGRIKSLRGKMKRVSNEWDNPPSLTRAEVGIWAKDFTERLGKVLSQTIDELEKQRKKLEKEKKPEKLKVILSIIDDTKEKIKASRLEEFQTVQTGQGVKDEGMWDFQIKKIMNKWPTFKGVIANDEIKKLKPENKMAFIINTADRDEPGEHWQAVLLDASPNVRAVEFFDSFGRKPSNRQVRDLKDLVDRLNPDHMLLFKQNRVKHQHPTSNTCGLHSINFLTKRLKGKSFIEATGYTPGGKNNKAKKFEGEVEKKFSEYL